MRILLTGSTGQIGQSLTPKLAELGELVVPSRSELDLADPSAILAFVDDVRPALAVNAAGYTAVDSAEQDAVLAQAALQGLRELRVVHGGGTGALRSLVRERLKGPLTPPTYLSRP